MRLIPTFLAFAAGLAIGYGSHFFSRRTAATTPPAVARSATPHNDAEYLAAMRAAFAEPIRHRHEARVWELLESLTPQNAQSVSALFAEFDRQGVRLDFAWNAVWTRWGEVDGPGVFAYLLAHRNETTTHWGFQPAMEGWASTDPVAAERWLSEHPDAPEFSALLTAMLGNWVRNDSDKATVAAFALPTNSQQISDALAAVTETLKRMGGSEAIAAWFERLNDSGKQLAFNHAAWRIKDGEIEAAARWFSAQANRPWRDDKHYYDFIARRADVDPAATMDWIVSLPPLAGARLPTGLRLGIEKWTAKSTPSVAQWLHQHRDAAWWPAGVAVYAGELRKKDVAAADGFLHGLEPAQREAVEREQKAK